MNDAAAKHRETMQIFQNFAYFFLCSLCLTRQVQPSFPLVAKAATRYPTPQLQRSADLSCFTLGAKETATHFRTLQRVT